MNRIKAGVVLFIVAEANFFALLVAAYVYFRLTALEVARSDRALDALKTALFSLALFGSSATVWRAGRNLGEGRRGRAAAWLCVTVLLGATFLVGQGLEYASLFRQDITVSRDLFGTAFFTLTGFHGLHVLVGLIMLTVLFALATMRDRRQPTGTAMEGVSLYWHFVDAVWVVIFSVVYLGRFV